MALPTCGAADAEEHVLERGRVVRIAPAVALVPVPCAVPVPTCSSTGELTGPASKMSPAISTPGTSATVIGDDAVLRGQRRHAEAEHDGVAAASP